MAALNATEQHITDPRRNGTFLVVTCAVRSSAVSDTLTLPEGLVSAADLPGTGGTAATVSCSGTTATITGGTAGAALEIVSKHVGNAAGL